MHDFLRLQLFSIENLCVLEYAQLYAETAYFVPLVLLNEALSGENLTIDERVDFIEIMIFYCQFHKMIYDKTKKIERAYQTGKSKCIFFFFFLIKINRRYDFDCFITKFNFTQLCWISVIK